MIKSNVKWDYDTNGNWTEWKLALICDKIKWISDYYLIHMTQNFKYLQITSISRLLIHLYTNLLNSYFELNNTYFILFIFYSLERGEEMIVQVPSVSLPDTRYILYIISKFIK